MVAHSGPGWRLAPTLVAMEREADRMAPRRSRISDGSIGDSAHAARVSDHNPSDGFVHALDLTHDPAGGFDAHAHARQVAARGDRRAKYIISRGEIWNPRNGWRRYVGANPHHAHAHFSVTDESVADVSPWFVGTPAPPTAEPPPPPDTSPAAEERTMIMRRHHNGQIWLYDGGGLTRSHVPTIEHAAALRRLGVPYDDISGNAINSQVLLDVTRDIDALGESLARADLTATHATV